MIFEDVVSGSGWQPEPAARYNAVNALLRENGALPPAPQRGKGGWSVGRVLFCNTSNSVIPAWSAVSLSAGTGSAADPLHCLAGAPASRESILWGVAQDRVPAGCCGEAVVSGITEAELVSNGDSTLNFAFPQSGGLVRSASGRAEILSVNGSRALLLLGGGSGGNSYNGCFKIVRTASGLAVINGSQPLNAVCGYTDLPGCSTVPRTEISGTPANVTLYVHYDSGTQTYRTSFTESANAVMSQIIGRISGNTITQIWQSDSICFSRFYFL